MLRLRKLTRTLEFYKTLSSSTVNYEVCAAARLDPEINKSGAYTSGALPDDNVLVRANAYFFTLTYIYI